MSMTEDSMHVVAILGAVVLSAAMFAPLVLFVEAADAKPRDPLEDMVVIEASLAMRKNPKKPQQPQKQFKTPDETKKPDGVSHDENKKVDPTKKDDEKKADPKEPDLDISKYKRPDPDDPTGKPIEAFNPNDSVDIGNDAVTKGDPYFGKLKTEMDNRFKVPSITTTSDADAPLGCIHLTAEGKIAESKFKHEAEGDIQIAAETALKEFVDAVNKKPIEVPPHLLQYTSRFICFKFTIK